MQFQDGLIVTLDGMLHRPQEALIRPDDRGVLRADGVFDVARCVDGAVENLDKHLQRFQRSAQIMSMPQPDMARIRAAVDTALQVWDWNVAIEATLRIVMTRGPSVPRGTQEQPLTWVAIEPISESVMHQRRHGVRAIQLNKGFDPAERTEVSWQPSGAKSLGYTDAMAALRYAAQQQADEVIFVTPHGAVLEGATSSVIVQQGSALITPEHPGILASTTVPRLERELAGQSILLERRPVDSRDLASADGLWLVSSGRLLAPVIELDGCALSRGSYDALLREILFAHPQK
jgi:4-amino-4-deoxychorismate lyase